MMMHVYKQSQSLNFLLSHMEHKVYQLDCDQNQKKKAFAESSQKQTTVKHVLDHSVSKQPSESGTACT